MEYFHLIGFLRGIMHYPGMPAELKKRIGEVASRVVDVSGYETRS